MSRIATLSYLVAVFWHPARAANVFDAQGNLYLISSPNHAGGSTTGNSFQASFVPSICGYFGYMHTQVPIACNHGFIQKVSSDGKKVLAATFLEGSGGDYISDIALDPAGNIVVTGSTSSTDFPVTSDAYQSKPGPAFLSILSPDCTKLIYSTYLSFGSPNAVAVDGSGRVILAGTTTGAQFPATLPVTSNNSNVQRDAFLVRFDIARSKLELAEEFGGTLDETVSAMRLDGAGNVYVTGYTSSTLTNTRFATVTSYVLFPVTPGALNSGNGTASLYITKFAPSGQMIYSAIFGGSRNDTSHTLNIDAAGKAYVTGTAASTDFSITAGAFRKQFSSGFASVLNEDGSQLLYSTFLGTEAPDLTTLDTSGNLLMAGTHYPFELNFPSSTDATQPCIPQSVSTAVPYFLRIDPSGARPHFGTLVYSVDSSGIAYLPAEGLNSRGQLFLQTFPGLFDVFTPAPANQSVTCIANAASYRSGAIAPGEIVTVLGPSIGPLSPETFQLKQGLVDNRLGGVQVFFNGVAAPLLYVSKNQINAIVPFGIAGQQTAAVQVINNGTMLPSVAVAVADHSPGVFTLDGSGSGYAAGREPGWNSQRRRPSCASRVDCFDVRDGRRRAATGSGGRQLRQWQEHAGRQPLALDAGVSVDPTLCRRCAAGGARFGPD